MVSFKSMKTRKRIRYTEKDLKEHLEKEHRQSPLATYLKEIVYGGNDGIITTFAVVAGFAGAEAGNPSNLSVLTLFLFGFANLFADAVSMALGNFMSVRADQDVYRSAKEKELYEIENEPEMEKLETEFILKQKGFSEKDAKTLTEIYSRNKSYWLEFMMKDELGMTNPEGENPYFTALATFVSFIVFGLIPLLPYVITGRSQGVFIYSVGATFIALFLLGVLRWYVTGRKFIKSVSEVLLLGGLAATIAYTVGVVWQKVF